MAVKETRAEIRWLQWGSEAFDLAASQGKLILADSGATWCHWCHVMDRMTYEDQEVIEQVNRWFIAIRIDRDRLSEVDAYLQRVPALLDSQGGGWPLTVILTPQGHVLFKATFVPPRPVRQLGSYGLVELLDRLDSYWRENRSQLEKAGQQMRESMAHQDDKTAIGGRGEPSPQHVAEMAAELKRQFDTTHGGFGSAPKFFSTTALSLLMTRAWAGDNTATDMVVKTLDSMAAGGVFDHVGGGFHRYSVDERWHVPHFEKMGYDNAALLGLYADAYALTGHEAYAQVARSTLAWVAQTLTDARGGFYSSQDADVGSDDDGDYFTWTVDEIRHAVGSDTELALYAFDASNEGHMHGRPGRNVLRHVKTLHQMAALLGIDETDLSVRLEAITQKLRQARAHRLAPRVDKTIFADINGMMIDAMLRCYERLGSDRALKIALGAMGHVLKNLRDDRGVFAHWSQDGQLREVGLLSDQAWMMRALIHAFVATSSFGYLAEARRMADYALANLIDAGGSPLSAPAMANQGTPASVPPMQAREDNPSRAAASVLAEALLDLGYLTGEPTYQQAGAAALASFADSFRSQWAIIMSGYGLAADRLEGGPRTIIVAGRLGDAKCQALLDSARRIYLPGGFAMMLDGDQQDHRDLLDRLGLAMHDIPTAYVCRAGACLEPAKTAKELCERMARLAEMELPQPANR